MIEAICQKPTVLLASNMKIESLPEDLLENIFSRISLKARTRLKCVSKNWCAFLNHLRKSLPQRTSFSIVLESSPFANCQFETLISATLLSFQEHATKCLLRTSFQLPELYWPKVLTSCNGLLLYYVERSNSDYWVFDDMYIVNPMLHQSRVLPRPTNLTSKTVLWFVGMSFFTEQHFKVILNTDGIIPGDKTAIFYIFESDKWEWKKHYASVITDVPCLEKGRSFCSYTWKEKMYFLYINDMAIYDVEQGVLKFVKLPTNGYKLDPMKRESFWPFEEHEEAFEICEEGGILWVSEGTLYYCISDTDFVFRLWSYDDVNDNWSLKMRFPRAGNKLKLRHMDLALHKVQLIGFNDDLQILYMKVCQIIISYSFETKRLARVWGQIFPVDNNLLTWQRGHPFVINPVNLYTGED